MRKKAKEKKIEKLTKELYRRQAITWENEAIREELTRTEREVKDKLVRIEKIGDEITLLIRERAKERKDLREIWHHLELVDKNVESLKDANMREIEEKLETLGINEV